MDHVRRDTTYAAPSLCVLAFSLEKVTDVHVLGLCFSNMVQRDGLRNLQHAPTAPSTSRDAMLLQLNTPNAWSSSTSYQKGTCLASHANACPALDYLRFTADGSGTGVANPSVREVSTVVFFGMYKLNESCIM